MKLKNPSYFRKSSIIHFCGANFVATSVLLGTFISSSLLQADSAWNGSVDSLWATAGNWTPGPAPSGLETATFSADMVAPAGSSTVTIGSTQVIRNIMFSSASAAAYTVNGGRFRIRDGGGISVGSLVNNNQIIDANLSLGITKTSAAYSLTNESTKLLTLNGYIKGDFAGSDTGVKSVSIGGAGSILVNGPIDDVAPVGDARTAVTKIGNGLVTLSGANNYSRATNVTAGTLKVTTQINNSNVVTVANGATLDFNGTGRVVGSGKSIGGGGLVTGGAITVESGGTLTSRDDGAGNLTFGSLDLQSDSSATFEMPTGGATSLVTISDLNGFSLNNVGITLLAKGTSSNFAEPGTYDLFQYSGTLGGLGDVSGLTMASEAAGIDYAFGISGSVVQVTLTSSGSFWDMDADGSWALGTNWTDDTVPNSVSALAAFGGGGTPITAPRAVTLDGGKTVGILSFDSAETFTLNPGTPGTSAITFDNTFGNARLDVLSGSHTVAAALVTPADFDLRVLSGADVTISGAISGAGSIILHDGGSATLSGSNSYTGGITVNDGTLTLEGDQTGAVGNITVGLADVPGRVLTIAAGATASVDAANGIQLGANNTSVNGANVAGMTVDGNMANDGTLTFGRPGSLTLNSGGSWTQTGAMAMRAWGNAGGPVMKVSAGSTFTYAGASTIKLNGPQVEASQTGFSTLTINGLFETNYGFEENLTITSGTGFAQVVINNGELQLTDNVPNLASSGNNRLRFIVQNTATVDTNGFDTTMGLPITGNGGLTKSGAGTLAMTGVNTYTGATVVTGGILSVNGTSIDDSGSLDIAGGIVSLTANETVATLTYDGGAPLPDGTYGSTASTATFKDNSRFDIANSGVLTVGASASGYQTWADANVGGEGPELDFDNDGTENGIEYFMNAPAGFTANPAIVSDSITWSNGGNIAPDQYGTQYVVQTSPNLVNWTNVEVGDLTTNDATTLTYDVPTGAGKLFVRLTVTPN